jgi:hypothetical protein
MKPPLSAQAEADFYLAEEEQGTYDVFWDNLGYFLDHGADFPPFSSLDRERPRRPNNRAPGWNGTFTFVFMWQQVDVEVQKGIIDSLQNDYRCQITEGESPRQWIAQVRITGKRVKSLTRMLNRQYNKDYLVWKEIENI